MRLKRLLLGLAGAVIGAAVLASGSTVTFAADYPKKPIRLISPYDSGGAADLAARILASTAPAYIGQGILVSNKTGAGGVTGSNYVVRSRPDGYTLLLARVGSQAGVPAINPNIPYKWNDYTFLGLLEKNPFVLVVNSKSSFKSLKDIQTGAKAALKSGKKLTYSTGGVGTLPHIAMVMLLDEFGLPADAMTHVPYKGGGKAAAALAGGHVDMFFQNLSGVIGQIRSGGLRALCVTTPKRYSAIKDVPTVAELGHKNLEVVVGWSALYGPPKMKQPAVKKWTAALQSIKTDKSWNKMTKKLGSIPAIMSPADTEKFAKTQYETFHAVAKKVGMVMKKK
ncbi:MAG: tripartite tricarboxylate transporter substrate binding protein [Alphaproteobacteria bacterium]|nr:tripartite tricarboxylate transporter substrate binding protein [Alphaproteobacteria bacterium]